MKKVTEAIEFTVFKVIDEFISIELFPFFPLGFIYQERSHRTRQPVDASAAPSVPYANEPAALAILT